MNQNDRKRKRTDDDEPYGQPPTKKSCLDEDQVYVETDHSSEDEYTEDTESYHSSEEESTDLDEPEVIDLTEPVKKIFTGYKETPRQFKLRGQWEKILPKIKRTSCSCDLGGEKCDYHDFDDDKKDMPSVPLERLMSVDQWLAVNGKPGMKKEIAETIINQVYEDPHLCCSS